MSWITGAMFMYGIVINSDILIPLEYKSSSIAQRRRPSGEGSCFAVNRRVFTSSIVKNLGNVFSILGREISSKG